MIDEAATITLHPGDVALGARGDRLETLLGSCVSIVLTDPKRTIGVMCHIVHARSAPSSVEPTGAYADVAFDSMVSLLAERGIRADLCEAWVYGGGNMFPQLIPNSTVGDDNVERALTLLAQHDIPVLDCDVGGDVYRQLHWTVGGSQPAVSRVQV